MVALVIALVSLIDEPVIDIEYLLNSLIADGLIISAPTIVSGIAGIGLIFVFIKIRRGLSVAEYLGFKPISVKMIIFLTILTIILTGILEIVNIYLIKESPESNLILEAYRNSTWPVLFWIAVVIFAPAFEEIFFRGFLFVGLNRSRIGPIGATLVTAFVWALLHIQYSIYGISTILLLGIILAVVRLRTRSLWGSIAIHSVWNLLAMISTVLYINGVGT